jgi:hypothetical protein
LKAESELSLDEDSSWCSQSGGEDNVTPSKTLMDGQPAPSTPTTKKEHSARHRGSSRARETDKPVSSELLSRLLHLLVQHQTK